MLAAKAYALLNQVSILEGGHRRALVDLQLIVEAGFDALGLKGSGPLADPVAAMHAAAENLRVCLQACRASVGLLEAEVSFANAEKDPAIEPCLRKLSAWLRGTVEGNITPAAGTLTLEVALEFIKKAADSDRTLHILGVRAFKLVNGAEKLAEVERGVRLRPADGSGGDPSLPPIKFTAAQMAQATRSFETDLVQEVTKLEAEVKAAAAASKLDVADVKGLAAHLEALRGVLARRATWRAAGGPIGLPADVIPLVEGIVIESRRVKPCRPNECRLTVFLKVR